MKDLAGDSLVSLWNSLDDAQREHVLDTWSDEDLAELSAELEAEAAAVQAQTDPLAHLSTAEWLEFMFPNIFTREMAEHHKDLCAWADTISIEQDAEDPAYIGVWPRGHSKCLDGDTPVLMADGTRQPLRSIVVGDRVVGYDGDLRARPAAVAAVECSGSKPCIQVRFASGRTLTLTEDHRVLAWGGWRRAGDLTVGDRVASPRRTAVDESPERPDAEVRLLAALMADGGLSQRAVIWTKSHPGLIEQMRGDAAAMGFDMAPMSKVDNSKSQWRLNKAKPWARSLGIMGFKSVDKRIPSFVFSLPERQRWVFLASLFDGDGYVANGDRLEIAFSNEPLIDQTADLLMSVGVASQKSHKDNDHAGSWVLSVDQNDLALCAASMPLVRLRDAVDAMVRTPRYSLFDTFPPDVWRHRSMRVRRYREAGVRITNAYQVTRGKLARAHGAGPSAEWARLLSADVWWDAVVAVEDAGHRLTYDIQVPETENFVSGYHVTHNSTLIEAIVAMMLCRGRRRYFLYCGDIQARAEDHLQNIASLLETDQVEHHYPNVGKRLLGKWGNVRGWRRMRIRCGNGATVDAIGLDTAARGVKLENMRPDGIVLDDIDQHADSLAETAKKIDVITLSLLPAGANNLAVFGVQNLINRRGVFARLVDRTAGFLEGARLSGPIPAIVDPVYGSDEKGRPCIVSGAPTWPSVKGIPQLNAEIIRFGLRAFRLEMQHEEVEAEGALWDQSLIDTHRVRSVMKAAPSALQDKAEGALSDADAEGALCSVLAEGALCRDGDPSAAPSAGNPTALPELTHVVIGVDPATTSKRTSDETGIIVAGKGIDGRCYILADLSGRYSPRRWARVVLAANQIWRADWVVCEVNNGGDLFEEVILANLEAGDERPNFSVVTASKGKFVRAEPIVGLYQAHSVYHCGVHVGLEREMTTWRPPNGLDPGSSWSPNRLDALVWAVWKLMVEYGTEQSYSSASVLESLSGRPGAEMDYVWLN